eukprot:scaffold46447_cov21-Tisochrysis_lutea.AAC.1
MAKMKPEVSVSSASAGRQGALALISTPLHSIGSPASSPGTRSSLERWVEFLGVLQGSPLWGGESSSWEPCKQPWDDVLSRAGGER